MNVLFDLDGTLTDPREGIVGCIKHALARLKYPLPSDDLLATFIGPPLRDTFGELLGLRENANDVEAAIAAYRERFSTVGMFENSVYEGIPEVLAELRARGAAMFVATSKPHVFAQRILDHFGLSKYFDAIYGSELDGRLADKTELVGHVVVAENLLARETVMVGDRMHDVIGALRNDVRPVGVLWGYGSESELVAAGAKRILKERTELVGLVPP